MSQAEATPNDPELFGKLIAGMTSLAAGSNLFFKIDNTRYDYPDDPDNLRDMGDSNFTLADDQGRNADGVSRVGDSLEPDNVERLVSVDFFGESARQQYSRIGEVVIANFIETFLVNSGQVDLYWVELNGTVWVRTEVLYGEDSYDEKKKPRRQLADFELDVLEKIIRGTIPSR